MAKGEQGLTIAFSADSSELICRITLPGFPAIVLSTDIENDGVRALAAQTLREALEKQAPQIAPPAPQIAPPSETLKFQTEESGKKVAKKTSKKAAKKTVKKTSKKNDKT